MCRGLPQVGWNTILCQIAAGKPPTEYQAEAKEALRDGRALAGSE